MALQTQNLVMVGLGIERNQPFNTIQPKLVDGIHLRWAFKRELGFPWYGYSLFRRNHAQGDPLFLSTPLIRMSIPQPIGTVLTVPFGPSFDATLSSDSDLFLGENFPYQHHSPVPVRQHPEFSLSPGSYLRFTFPDDEPARWIRVYVGFTGPQTEIQVTGFYKGRRVAKETVAGQQGEIKTVVLEYNAISAIELSSGPASLIDLGFVPVSQDASAHWVPLFSEALCLPVAHQNYPCAGAPGDQVMAEKMALARIRYGWGKTWSGAGFTPLFNQLVEMVKDGPGGSKTMAQQQTPAVQGIPTSQPQATASPKLTGQYPLNLLLLGALHPAFAQMVGLYWVDETAQSGVEYDYLLVANHRMPNWTLADGFDFVDAFIVFKLKKGPAPPLSAPAELHTYALPSAENTVGLRWDATKPELASLEIMKPLMYHIWRASLGNGVSPTAPGNYDLLTEEGAVMLVEPVNAAGKVTKPPSDWPPDRLHYLDRGLADGWYSYQVSGVDIFGRHSQNSPAGPWYQWSPAPNPEPWYYIKPAPVDSIVHPAAVRLLDTLPPPPPTGIEAYALDPADPTVLKDAAYTAWWNALTASSWYQALTPNDKKNRIGLRVRWQWTHMHMRQAPDTYEFRIYYHPDPMNVLVGKIVSVTAANAKQSNVQLDISNSLSADAYKALWLQVGIDAFQVVSSQAGSPLHLTVSNLGAKDEIQPQANMPCLLVIPEGNPNFEDPLQVPHFVDYSIATKWQERYYVVGYNASVTQTLTLAFDPSGKALSGSTAGVSGTTIALDGAPDLSKTQPSGEFLFLGNDTNRQDKIYPIVAVDDLAKTVNVDGTPNTAGAPSAWKIGFPLRTYEVFLPTPDGTFKSNLPLVTSPVEPIKYAHVSVSAADDKAYSKDKRTSGSWANRTGNEGPVGVRAKIFRVQRELPPAPEIPLFDSDKVYATAADYHSRSFYTFRWAPITDTGNPPKVLPVGYHIFRALDGSVFQADWSWRSKLTSDFVLSATDPDHLQKYFPAELRKNDSATIARRNDVVSKLNGLSSISPTANSDDVRAAYRALTNDALRVLAGLPGSDPAFTQLTIQPLDPQEPDPDNPTLLRWRDRIGPDNPSAYAVDAALRSYMDTLDGRSTNCYFYRAGSVDGAHNRSEGLSLSSPPVYCPDVTPPRAPVITKIFAGGPDPLVPGDRKITLKWASNREPDLKEYRLYRTDNKDAARDLRLMTLVRTEPETRAPAVRSAQIIWTDTPVPGLVMFYYRLISVDNADNVSEVSQIVSCRTYQSAPKPPTVDTPTWDAGHGSVAVTWQMENTFLTPRLERRRGEGDPWTVAVDWMSAGTLTALDTPPDPSLAYEYRIRVRDHIRQQALSQAVATP